MLKWFGLLLFVSPLCAGIAVGPAREISDYITGPGYAKAADMDGDADLDVIASSQWGDRVLWWENDGSGHFTERHDWTWKVDEGMADALADANGDGRPDLWFQRGGPAEESEIWISHCNPDGTFTDPSLVLATNHYLVIREALADVNRDGRMDLMAHTGVHFRQADGTFSQPPPSDGGTGRLPLSEFVGVTAIGNFGGSGIAQFLSREPQRIARQTVLADGSIQPSETAIHFAPTETVFWMAGIPAEAPEGRERLVVCLQDGGTYPPVNRIALVTFDADGNGSEAKSITSELFGHNPTLHDFTWEKFTQRLLLTLNHADPRRESRLIALGFDSGKMTLRTLFSFIGATRGISLGDLDGDGTPDLFFPLVALNGTSGTYYSQLIWHKGIAGNTFESAARSVNQPGLSSTLDHVGDIDADGDVDIVTSGTYPLAPESVPSHEILVWRNTGNAFTRQVVTDEHDCAQVLEAQDLDGDSLKDLLVLTYDYDVPEPPFKGVQRIIVYYQQSDGSFRPVVRSEARRSARDYLLAFADWNNDGVKDLLFNGSSSSDYFAPLVWYQGTVAGEFLSPRVLLADIFLSPHLVDIDRDGDLDVVGASFLFGDTSLWGENDGSGDISTVHKLSNNIFPLGADLDNDGFMDFMSSNGYHLSRPGVTFESIPTLLPRFPEYLDLDGDGDPDAIVEQPYKGSSGLLSIGWLENKGGGHFEPALASDGDGNQHYVSRPISDTRSTDHYQTAMGDVDGDGTPDLVALSPQNRLEWFKITHTPVPSIFAEWMSGRNLRGQSASPGEDWDGDGVTNWSEFAFGSDPALKDPAFPGRPRMIPDNGGMTFSYHRRVDAAAAGLAYPMARSTNLIDWQTWTPPLTTSPAMEGYEQVTIPVASDKPAEFFRVGVPDAQD